MSWQLELSLEDFVELVGDYVFNFVMGHPNRKVRIYRATFEVTVWIHDSPEPRTETFQVTIYGSRADLSDIYAQLERFLSEYDVISWNMIDLQEYDIGIPEMQEAGWI